MAADLGEACPPALIDNHFVRGHSVPPWWYEVSEQPAATDVLDRLAADPEMTPAIEAIERIIDRLSADPFDRRLGTTTFSTELLGDVSATPARLDDWYVIWRRGTRPRSLVLVGIVQLTVGKPG